MTKYSLSEIVSLIIGYIRKRNDHNWPNQQDRVNVLMIWICNVYTLHKNIAVSYADIFIGATVSVQAPPAPGAVAYKSTGYAL